MCMVLEQSLYGVCVESGGVEWNVQYLNECCNDGCEKSVRGL